VSPRRPPLGPVWLAVGLSLLAAASVARQTERNHPRLVSVAATRCSTCHQALFQDKANVHPPAQDDCTNCHEPRIDEDGTRMALVDEEPAMCLTCHSDLEAAATLEVEVPHAAVADSCLNCHDPHASETERLLAAPAAELCATCHDTDDLQEAHGGQLTARVDCLSCHVPHGSANPHMVRGTTLHPPFADGTCEACHRAPFAGRVRLVRRGQKLCTSCHSDLEEPAPEGGSRHAALEGTRRDTACLSCHDPHMSVNATLLIETGPPLCAQCHEDVVQGATAETGHVPAAAECTICHQPHSAPHSRLLIEAPESLCPMCHDVEDADLSKAHLGADLAALECTSCHNPHGTGNPKLLARHIHPVILDGCATCHIDSASDLVEDGGSALCLACHDNIQATAEAAAVPHPALEMIRCADCHNPHASPQRKLVKQPAGGECLLCHFEQGASEGETAHGAVRLVGCEACHDPHGGSRAKLLREEGDALCLGCHANVKARSREEKGDRALLAGRFEVSLKEAEGIPRVLLSSEGTRGHPISNHPVKGTITADAHRRTPVNFEGELGCLTCHDPHRGKTQLLRWDAASVDESCLHCHPK
jgi:predicted CXXCH cytochrome family protein